MKTYSYLEINPGKGIGFALAYIALIVVVLSVVFGGFGGLADAVNNFGSGKGLVFLTAIIFIMPVFFLIRFIYPKVSINADATMLIILKKNQPDLLINYNEIYALALNAQRLNTLTLYGKSNEVLFHIQPFNNHQLMPELVNEIKKSNTFSKSVTQKRLLNTTYDMIVYQRN